MDKEVDMLYLDETDTQKLGALLSEARKKYSRAALERVEETFAMAVGAKPLIGPEDPSQEGTDFYFAGLAAKYGHNPADFSIVPKLKQAWEEKRMLRRLSR
jgi:hypothetical protein